MRRPPSHPQIYVIIIMVIICWILDLKVHGHCVFKEIRSEKVFVIQSLLFSAASLRLTILGLLRGKYVRLWVSVDTCWIGGSGSLKRDARVEKFKLFEQQSVLEYTNTRRFAYTITLVIRKFVYVSLVQRHISYIVTSYIMRSLIK
jgi:hypothetical protein